jgi:hypothetical protein
MLLVNLQNQPRQGREKVAGGKRSAATGSTATVPAYRPGGAAEIVPPPDLKIERPRFSGGRASLAAGYLLSAPPARRAGHVIEIRISVHLLITWK